MAFQSPSHANAHAVQTSILLDLIGKPKARHKGGASEPKLMDARAKCELIRTWIELEHLKRELRGIPRLKAVEIDPLMRRAKRAIAAPAEPVEA